MLLLALAPAAVAAPYPLDVACTWADTRWDHDATLLVEGTATPLGRSGARRPVLMTGELGLDAWGAPRLRATFAGQGLTVRADVDVNEDGVFELSGDALPVGPATLVPGGEVRIVGFRGDHVLIGPGRWTTDTVAPRGPLSVEVGCDRVNVWDSLGKGDPTLLSEAGLAGEPRALAVDGKVRLRETPEGPVVAVVRRQDGPRVVYLVEQREGWAHVALPHWQGTVWHGWTDAPLTTPPEPGTAGILGLLGGSGYDPFGQQVCDVELPLFGGRAQAPVEIGRVAAGTPFRVVGERGEHVAVEFPEGWLAPADGAELRLPASAAACAER